MGVRRFGKTVFIWPAGKPENQSFLSCFKIVRIEIPLFEEIVQDEQRVNIAGMDAEKDLVCNVGEIFSVAFSRYIEHTKARRKKNLSGWKDGSCDF